MRVAQIVKKITQQIHDNVKACNLSGEKRNNNFFAPLVLLCQKKCDAILSRTDCSFLERIQLCAKEVESFGAGNCMTQSFLALDYLIKEFITTDLSTYDSCIPISICTYGNHAFLLVNDNIICDPWANSVGDLAMSPYAGLKLETYFGIRSDWTCYDSNKSDVESTKYTFSLFAPQRNIYLKDDAISAVSEKLVTQDDESQSNKHLF